MRKPEVKRLGEWALEAHVLAFLTQELTLYPYRKKLLESTELDLIMTTPFAVGMPKGNSLHGDPTFGAVARLMADPDRQRLKAFCDAVEEVMDDEEFPAEWRKVVTLCLFEEMDEAAAAAQLDMPAEHVSYYLNRAMVAFAAVLTRPGAMRYMGPPRRIQVDELNVCAD